MKKLVFLILGFAGLLANADVKEMHELGLSEKQYELYQLYFGPPADNKPLMFRAQHRLLENKIVELPDGWILLPKGMRGVEYMPHFNTETKTADVRELLAASTSVSVSGGRNVRRLSQEVVLNVRPNQMFLPNPGQEITLLVPSKEVCALVIAEQE